jgi:hypothetical protein
MLDVVQSGEREEGSDPEVLSEAVEVKGGSLLDF